MWREREREKRKGERERERGWVECFNTRINEKYKMEKHWTTSSHPTQVLILGTIVLNPRSIS
jgi:hypothetical protein